MKVPDVNVLLYALDEASVHHTKARQWLDHSLSGDEPVGFAWIVLIAFLRLSTQARVFAHPLQPVEAFEILEGWLSQAPAQLIHPTARHAAILRGLVEPLGAAGNIINDAHLAALAIEHGAEVCSGDSDFARFAGLRWTNPFR